MLEEYYQEQEAYMNAEAPNANPEDIVSMFEELEEEHVDFEEFISGEY